MNLDAPLVPLERFALTPDVRHLNHGSFGGCPLEVIQAAERCRRHVEAAPMRFFVLEWQAAIDAARLPLARFLNAPSQRGHGSTDAVGERRLRVPEIADGVGAVE